MSEDKYVIRERFFTLYAGKTSEGELELVMRIEGIGGAKIVLCPEEAVKLAKWILGVFRKHA